MYDWLRFAYPLGMATIEQCKMAVEKGKITAEQFKDITGVDYIQLVHNWYNCGGVSFGTPFLFDHSWYIGIVLLC